MNKIDVFGATGFIGSRFCELYSKETIISPRDCDSPVEYNVLYLISTTDNYNVLTDLHVDINTNLNKLMDVLENCKENKNIVFTFISSWFVYGDCWLPAKEDSVCNPRGFYSITKKAAEDLLVSFCKTFNINYRILRLCNVYGPNDKGKGKKKNALQYLINEIKEGRDINLYHGGHFVRDYMYVDDICKAIKLCVEKAPLNEIINIGSGMPYEFIDLISFVALKTNYKGKINTVEPTAFHKIVQVKDFYMDITKLKQLEFEPDIRIEDGLEKLL